MNRPLVMVAGEHSGDRLGSELIAALRRRHNALTLCGIGGPAMRAAGFDAWWDIETLSVMGLVEVLRHVPRLLRLRRRLYDRIVALRPAVVVTIDNPDFTLPLGVKLRRAGIRVVHLVSPSIWAWRPGRVRTVARAADLLLCLLPFEPACYEGSGIEARYIGHPLADRIPLTADRAAAKKALGIAPETPVLALLPGSRGAERRRLARDFLDAAARLTAQRPGLRLLAVQPDETGRTELAALAARWQPDLALDITTGEAGAILAAADVALVASGTATLEAVLHHCPLTVAYRLHPATYHFLRLARLYRARWFSLPNLLAGETVVEEYLQHDAAAATLAASLSRLLDDAPRRAALEARFRELHRKLSCAAAERAAAAIGEVIDRR